MPPPARSLRPASRAALVRYWLTRTFSGRAVVVGLLVKVVAFVLTLVLGRPAWLELVDTVGDLAVMLGALIVGLRLYVGLKQQLLWRVRRRLILSYIFIGFVPALLIIVFFLVSGLLLLFNIAGYMMRTEMEQLVDHTRFVAESTAVGVARAEGSADIERSLNAREALLASRYPGGSITLVPTAGRCASGSRAAASPERVVVGPWAHRPAPAVVPAWVPCSGYAGLTAYTVAGETRVTSRAVIWPGGAGWAVVVDVPVDQTVERELREQAGVSLGAMTAFEDSLIDAIPDLDPEQGRTPRTIVLGPSNIGVGSGDGTLRWVTWIDYLDWETGSQATLLVSFRMSIADIYDRLAPKSASALGDQDFGSTLLGLLAVVGILFLIIQVVAFAMGLALARSITGSVHELFAGTERVRRGDFTGRVYIRSRDQMGELATSFNSMTASIEDLLQQKAEKERLEQELRIARSIQMSLLPQGPLVMPGLTLTAHCEPAREVGGDYYDFLPIDEHTVGILIADVSGKGTSAALYMAELKGIVLSLSQRYRSPREMLIEADRIISNHLDSRSFITVTYVVVDLRAGTLRYARAGHCPLVYVPGPYADARSPQLIAPDGLVLGLQFDEGRTFVRLLEEVTVPLGRGDLFVLYTDGMTEAMNAEGECFGDERLASLIGQHPDLGGDELRERILRDVDAFTGSAVQQDDMTMVLLRVEQVGQPRIAPVLAHADA